MDSNMNVQHRTSKKDVASLLELSIRKHEIPILILVRDKLQLESRSLDEFVNYPIHRKKGIIFNRLKYKLAAEGVPNSAFDVGRSMFDVQLSS